MLFYHSYIQFTHLKVWPKMEIRGWVFPCTWCARCTHLGWPPCTRTSCCHGDPLFLGCPPFQVRRFSRQYHLELFIGFTLRWYRWIGYSDAIKRVLLETTFAQKPEHIGMNKCERHFEFKMNCLTIRVN